MQSVTVSYRQHNSTAVWKWLWKQGQFWPNLLIIGIPYVAFLPLLIGLSRHGQWLAFAMVLGAIVYFTYMIITSQRRNYATTASMLPTMTFTLFPECFQVDLERGSWSRRAWTSVEKLVSLESGLVFFFREYGGEVFYEVPRAAFASPAEYEAWCAQAQRWHQEAQAKQRVLAPAELLLTERYQTAQSLRYEELQLWLAQRKLAEEFPHTLPQTTSEEPPSSRGRDFARGSLFLAAAALVLHDPTAREPAEPLLMLFLLMLSIVLIMFCMKVAGSIADYLARTKHVAKDPAQVIFAEQGILTRSKLYEHFRSWLDVDALTVDQERLLLWFNGNSCGIFPHRAFATAEEAATVEEWMRGKIQQREVELNRAEFADERPAVPRVPESYNPYQAPQH